MSDRELLEWAAKAAGILLHHWSKDGEFIRVDESTDDDGEAWNPLVDDGDALRLAVKLRINIEHMRTMNGKDFGINCWPVGRGDCGASEDGDLTDYDAATRRAVVRAAASIGQQKEGG